MRALLLLLLVGCADLPDLGTCGNGIVEEANGEACDDGKDTDTCNATCELKCLTAATDGYVEARTGFFCPTPPFGGTVACGNDTVCRRPSGELEPPTSPVPFDVRQVPLVADFDGDGYADLVGTSATSIVVRFGGLQALASTQVQEAPSSLSPLLPFAVGDRTLLAVPTEGVALLESDGERFVPSIDFVATGVLSAGGVVVRDPDPALGDVLITVQPKAADSTLAVFRQGLKVGAFPGVPQVPLTSCTGAAAGPWHTVGIQLADDRRSFVVITTRDAAPFSSHICRYTPSGTTWSLADFELPGPVTSAVLANLDADACDELLVQSNAAASYGLVDATGPGCAFAPAIAPVTDDVTGDAFQVLASGQIIPGGTDEIVTTQGVFECGTDCSTLVRRISPSSALAWTRAAVTDLNGDGAGDVVAARAAQDDIDVVRGGGTLNVYRSDTASIVTNVLAGDFDGDRLGDVALVETSGAGDRLSVIYGTREGPLGAVHPMTAFGGKLEIHRLVSYNWLPSARATDGIDDVLVVRADMATNSVSAALSMGDAARIMTTPRFPPTISSKQEIGAVIAGRIGSPDVELGTIVSAGSNTVLQLYNVNANSWAPPLTVMGSIRAPLGALHGAADQDTAVGLTGSLTTPNLVTFSARSPMPVCATTPLPAAPRELRGVDLEGRRIDKLVVLTGELDKRSLQIFDTATCPATEVAKTAVDNCVDIASIDARTVAACRTLPMGPATTLFAVTEQDRDPTPLARLAGDVRFIAAGDFDGDGLRDLAVGVALGTELNVQMLRQCPLHDTRACR